MGLVVKAAVALLSQSLKEAAEAICPVVVTCQLWEARVEEVEDEVVREQIIVAVVEAGGEERSDPGDDVQVRLLG